MKGQITNACDFVFFISFLIHSYPAFLFSDGTSQVLIRCLPSGISSRYDISKSPYNVRATVRGIGVAVIVRRWGFLPLFLMIPRCSTPKRCCSSITMKPRLSNLIFSYSTACVPTRISVSSIGYLVLGIFFLFLYFIFGTLYLLLPVCRPTFTPNGSRRFVT